MDNVNTHNIVDVIVCPMDTPSDLSRITQALDSGAVAAADIVAIVGKSEGTGLAKDLGREAVDAGLRTLLAQRLHIPHEEVANRITIILSGGSPGVLTPHVTLISRRTEPGSSSGAVAGGRLVIGRAGSAPILPEHVGRTAQVDIVADAVRLAVADAGILDVGDIHLVLVKAPALTAESIADAVARGADTVTADLSIGPEGAICYSNDASALGVAVAIGEVQRSEITDFTIRHDWSKYSDVAMTSSGGEKHHAEVVVLGNSSNAGGRLRIGHHSMRNLLDADAVTQALANARSQPPCADANHADDIVYLLAKMIIPGSDRLAGQRITLLDDPVGYHVAKAMGGYLLASVTGNTACFVSGGERNSHQGPPDGNPLAAIVTITDPLSGDEFSGRPVSPSTFL